jgi:hypothetical protein
VKHKAVIIIISACAVGMLMWMLLAGNQPSLPALPSPNGYDDFVVAVQSLAVPDRNFLTNSPVALRSIVEQNSNVLALARSGLQKECAVPVGYDTNWIAANMPQFMGSKVIAQLFVAEGILHEQGGRTNDAVRSYADCIRFGHAISRQGLLINHLIGFACQAIGSQRLVPVDASASPETLRPVLQELLALEQAREPASAVLTREREWSRSQYGSFKLLWLRLVMRKPLRDTEESFEKTRNRSVAALRLVIVELAVRLHQKQHGKLPATLDELVPALLPAVPLDPYTGRPLVYRVTTNSFLLYSIGPDGQDDGGTPMARGKLGKGDLLPSAQ